MTLRQATSDFQREYISEALAQCGGNVCEAARVLGIHRNTASRFIAALGIDVEAERRRRRMEDAGVNVRAYQRQQSIERAIDPQMMREYNKGSVYFRSPTPKPVNRVDRMLELAAAVQRKS